MAFGSTAAAQADVEFTATTGPAKSGIEELRATFSKATAGMSADALKLQSAQERLDASLVRSHGQVTRSTLAAELNLRSLTDANVKTAASSDAASAAVRREGTEIERLGRGALVGSGLVRGLGRAAAFSSTAFLGGAGLVYAVKTFTKAAEEHQAVEAQLAAALRAQGINYAAYRGQIDETLAAQERLTGFSEDETSQAFTKLVRATGDVNVALKLNATAANIARGSGKDLGTVAAAVTKAYDGQTGALRRLVPSIKAGVSGQQAIAQASKQFAGSAQAYADTAAGAQARLTQAIHQTEIAIGTALIPTVQRLETHLTNWLNDSKNQKKLQNDINTAVSQGTLVIEGLARGIRLVEDVLGPVVADLGGFENAAELAFGIALLLKLNKARIAIGGLLTSLRLIGPTTAASAAVADSALVTLVGEYTGVGAAATAAAATTETAMAGIGASATAAAGAEVAASSTGVGLLLARLGALGALGPIGVTIAITETFRKQLFGAGTGLDFSEPTAKDVSGGSKSPYPKGSPDDDLYQLGAAGKPRPKGLIQAPFSDGLLAYNAGARHRTNKATKALSNLPGAYGSYTNPSYISPAQQRANDLALHPDSLSALGNQLTYDKSAIAFLQKRFAAGKIDGADYSKQLQALAGDEASTQSQITSIQQAAAQKVKDARAAAAAAAAKAAAAYKASISVQAQKLKNSVTKSLLGNPSAVGAPLFASEGPVSNYRAAFAHNRPLAVAPPANGGKGPYQTKLTASQEKRFRAWVAKNHVPFDVNSKDVDYDMRGYWLAMTQGQEPAWAGGKTHFPDTFKTPFDTTFSNQSKYSLPSNPDMWKGNNLVNNKTGQLIFGSSSSASPVAKLIAFYKKESADTKLSKADRARYAALALSEEKSVNDEIAAENKKRAKLAADRKKLLAARLATQNELGDAILQNALASAQLAETQAGTNTSKLAKAQGAELAAQEAILAQEQKEGKSLTGLALEQNKSNQIQTRTAIAQLKQQSTSGRADEQSLADALLQNALATAQLRETQAGTNAAKLKKAQARELAVYLAILRQEQSEEKGLTGAALVQKKAEEIATKQSIAQLKNATAPVAGAAGANEAQFLSSFEQIVSSYAPNAFPAGGKTDTHLFNLVTESRQTNRHLTSIRKNAKFPGTYGSKLALEAAYG